MEILCVLGVIIASLASAVAEVVPEAHNAGGLGRRDVVAATLFYPSNATWFSGQSHNVTWDISSFPPNSTFIGQLMLGEDGVVEDGAPTASSFALSAGRVQIKVPNVPSGEYMWLLQGSSNGSNTTVSGIGPTFSLINNSPKTSSFVSGSSISIPSSTTSSNSSASLTSSSSLSSNSSITSTTSTNTGATTIVSSTTVNGSATATTLTFTSPASSQTGSGSTTGTGTSTIVVTVTSASGSSTRRPFPMLLMGRVILGLGVIAATGVLFL